jgi:Luciferase
MAAARLSMAECASVSRVPDGGRRRVRGLGGGRATRRVLARGGSGPARALNTALGGWEGVRITPMFGRWGYFVGERLFACFPLRDKDRDLWVRLASTDQARALREPGVRPHRRFARRGWIELTLADEHDVGRALRWLRQAHAAAARGDELGADPP